MKTAYIQNKNKKHIWYLFKIQEPNIAIRIATYNKKSNKLTIDVDKVENIIFSVNIFASLIKIANERSEDNE